MEENGRAPQGLAIVSLSGDVIPSHPTRKEERELAPHPSLKPQSFLRQVVRAILPLGEGVVLDPFAGSGSTLAAASAVGYRSIGVEVDATYVGVARRGMPALKKLAVKARSNGSSANGAAPARRNGAEGSGRADRFQSNATDSSVHPEARDRSSRA